MSRAALRLAPEIPPQPELNPAYGAYRLLHVAFVLLVVVAGVDKYFHLLTNWEQYLSPVAIRILGESGTHTFFMLDGAFEILVGIGLAFMPRVFSYVVAAWLFGISINLLTTGHFYDIVLRDLTLCLAALALGKLSALNSAYSP